MLHHRIQTDLEGSDAGVQASTPCTSGSTKSCADCRALCEYDRMQEVAAGCMQEVAACMQASCSLHAACIRSYAEVCSILHAGCSRLHAACMHL